jgi:coproporphyrinogen III oxidase-like Fe-S oxidoreductase
VPPRAGGSWRAVTLTGIARPLLEADAPKDEGDGAATAPASLYVHVPFCFSICP